MRMFLNRIILAIALAGALTGCANQRTIAREAHQPVTADPATVSRRVDAFVVVLDTASSMERTYQDRRNVERASEIIARLNRTIPELDYRASLVAFSAGSCLSCEDAEVVYGPATYRRADFDAAFARYHASMSGRRAGARGAGPQASQLILQDSPGNVAIIVVSDSENMLHGRAVKTVQKLRWSLGNRLCLYPVLVDRDCEGRVMTEQIVKVGGCGFAVNADDIATPSAMARYVEEIFLAPAAAAVAPVAAAPAGLDSDGDGVPNGRDRCPGTPAGVSVDADGCWVLHGIFFDSDEAVIKDRRALDQAVAVFKANPSLTADAQGHTDSTASAEHNQTLSENRARAVRDYFIRAGVAPERIRATGFGETRPVASNDTVEGRARNRRVELHPARH